jgi:membrane fusion protein (multidrug efflux system)
MKRVFFALLAVALAGASCNKKSPGAGRDNASFAVQVVVVEAKRQPVSEALSLVGTLTANEMVELKCEAEGTIEEILFQEGQPVKRGDLLLRLDESKFASAAAEAEANFKLSQANYERSKELLRAKLISQQEFEQASALFQANQAGLDLRKRLWKDSRIFAPFDGIISSRNVSPGQVISRNTTFSWLVDLDPVKVEVSVPERFLSQLALGQNIDITVATYAGRKFTGKVFFIAPFVDPAFRTALVKAKIPNPLHELKPGMFANLDLTLRIRDNSVLIPEPAIVQFLEDQRAQIFTVSPSNTVQLHIVQLGVRLPGQVEVLSGLSGGEKVIVEGTQKIGPGAKVKFAPAEAAAPYAGQEGKEESGKVRGSALAE